MPDRCFADMKAFHIHSLRPKPIRRYDPGERVEVFNRATHKWDPATAIGYLTRSGYELLFVWVDGEKWPEAHIPNSDNFRECPQQATLF